MTDPKKPQTGAANHDDLFFGTMLPHNPPIDSGPSKVQKSLLPHNPAVPPKAPAAPSAEQPAAPPTEKSEKK